MPEKSIKKHIGAIRKISGDLTQLKLIQTSLEDLTSANELQKLNEQYFNVLEHKESNQRGNRMYSAALIAKNKMGFNWKTIAGPMH